MSCPTCQSAPLAAGASYPDLLVCRRLPVSRFHAFKAWTDPRQVQQWWGPHGFSNPRCVWEARPGGKIEIDMRAPDGTLYPMIGEIENVCEPERLIFTSKALGAAGLPMFEVANTVTFAEQNGETILDLLAHVRWASDEAAPYLSQRGEGWIQTLERLEEFLVKA